jgi:parallel beta-helix repeat protein
MQRRFIVYSLVIVISLLLPMTHIQTEPPSEKRPSQPIVEQSSSPVRLSLTSHGPITIISDQNFTDTASAEGWPGDGSTQNPFIIDGLDIDCGGSPGHCISISNTRVNFTIRNCNLTGASVTPGAGIYLSNVSHARITNNNCSANRYGINLVSRSDYNSIINNTCNANNRGIRIATSHYIIIEGNDCEDNGDGIYLTGAEWCQVKRNWINSSVWSGIHFEAADFGSIINNTCQYNIEAGISFIVSSTGLIANNTCRNNTWGIYLWESSHSDVTNNTFVNNDYGFFIESGPSDCVFSWNILESNRVLNAEDHGYSSEIMYNYWSDYSGTDADGDGIGDTPHALPDAVDPLPLMHNPTPPRWVLMPYDVIIEESAELYHAYYEAIAPAPLTWWVSDGVHFTLDDSGHLISRYFLEAITYELKIVVSNIYGSSISADFTIRVTEDIPPSWMFAPNDQILDANEALDYQLIAIDSSGIAGWELNNTMQFGLSESYYEDGSTVRLTNTTFLSPGTYALNISVFDTHDNKLSSIFSITVKPQIFDSTAPSWVIVSLRDVIEFGEPFALQFGAWDASGIDHWWISDSINFSIDESGLITNATRLEIGQYNFEVRVYDSFDNYASAILTITVVSSQTTPPPLDLFPVLTLAGGAGIGVIVAGVVLMFWRRNGGE